MVGVGERMRERIVDQFAAVLGERLLRQVGRTGNQIAGDAAARAALATPHCTAIIARGYQLVRNSQKMPPWWVTSRYKSAPPSQAQIAARCGGCRLATCQAFMAK
jgi:hypothetical protein